jgi:hypothetical protein
MKQPFSITKMSKCPIRSREENSMAYGAIGVVGMEIVLVL